MPQNNGPVTANRKGNDPHNSHYWVGTNQTIGHTSGLGRATCEDEKDCCGKEGIHPLLICFGRALPRKESKRIKDQRCKRRAMRYPWFEFRTDEEYQ
jgi:hypothetical protein